MIDISIFLFLLALSSFFSSSETAFFSLSHAKVRMMQAEGGKTNDIVQKLKRDPQKLLVTILIGNNIVNLFTASYATVVATRYFDSAALGVATGATTLLILIFGEVIPKSFAYASNVKFAKATAWPIYFFSIICTPLTVILVELSKKLSQLAGHDENQHNHVTEEEVRIMSRMGVESGKINYREHEMIENIFRFDDINVEQVMTPWYKVSTLSGLVPVEQIAHFVSHEGYSRYPVHDGKNEDNIIGYVHVNDLMKALNSDSRDQPLENFVSKITRVREGYAIERAFRAMLRDHTHILLVKGPKGKDEIKGLVTLEDVIEEILGEIVDETDKERIDAEQENEKS